MFLCYLFLRLTLICHETTGSDQRLHIQPPTCPDEPMPDSILSVRRGECTVSPFNYLFFYWFFICTITTVPVAQVVPAAVTVRVTMTFRPLISTTLPRTSSSVLIGVGVK